MIIPHEERQGAWNLAFLEKTLKKPPSPPQDCEVYNWIVYHQFILRSLTLLRKIIYVLVVLSVLAGCESPTQTVQPTLSVTNTSTPLPTSTYTPTGTPVPTLS